MTERGDGYVKKLDAIFAEYGDLLDQIDDSQWSSVAPIDGRQINVLFDHAVGAQANLTSVANNLATGAPQMDLTIEMIDHGNAEHMRAASDVSRADVKTRLQSAVEGYRALIPGLSDEALDRSQSITLLGGTVTTAQVIEWAMIGHSSDHLNSLKEAIASA